MKTTKPRGPYTPPTPDEVQVIESLYKKHHTIGHIAKTISRSQSFVWQVLHAKKEVETGFFDVDKFAKESWYLNISEKKVN